MMPDKRSEEQKAKDAYNVLNRLKAIREPFEEEIDYVIKYGLHSRRKVSDYTWNKGKRTGQDVYDGTVIGAINLTADGIYGHSFAPSLRWFAYTLPNKLNFPRTSSMRAWSGKRMDEYPQVAIWLGEVEEVMYASFLRGNFYDVSLDVIRDCVSIGTVTTMMEEDINTGKTIYTVPHFRECYIAENRYGVVDTNYRVYPFTLRQMVDKFGLERMKKAIRDFDNIYKKNPYEEKQILHCVYPKQDYDFSLIGNASKPYASEWYLMEGDKTPVFLGDGGYDYKSCITWRWRKNSDEWYGRSPVWDAMVDVLTANQMGETNLIAGHKMAEPPMIGPSDLRNKIRSMPGGWTFMESWHRDRAPMPMNTGIQIPFPRELQERLDQKINEHLHTGFFLLLSQAAMARVELTATQTIEMTAEKAAILGARTARAESEFLNPVHDNQFEIERRAGRIPGPPQILLDNIGDSNIEVDYLGPLPQAQKRLFKTQGIRAGMDFIANMSQAYPEILDILNVDETGKEVLKGYGFPAKLINDDATIESIRTKRQQQREIEEMVEGAAKLGKTMPGAQKEIEPNSPMDMLLGGGAEA